MFKGTLNKNFKLSIYSNNNYNAFFCLLRMMSFYIKLMKGKAHRKHSLHEKTAASYFKAYEETSSDMLLFFMSVLIWRSYLPFMFLIFQIVVLNIVICTVHKLFLTVDKIDKTAIGIKLWQSTRLKLLTITFKIFSYHK